MTRATYISIKADWLRQFAWDWYFTGTFRQPVTEFGVRHLMNCYAARLRKAGADDINLFWAVEKGRLGRLHVHALIGSTRTLLNTCGSDTRCMSGCGTHLWTYGHSVVRQFEDGGAAPFYVSKNYGTDGEWDIIGTPLQIIATALRPERTS